MPKLLPRFYRKPSLSEQLEQALMMEDYHRAQLLWWKQRRQYLQTQIPIDDPFQQFVEDLQNDTEYPVISP